MGIRVLTKHVAAVRQALTDVPPELDGDGLAARIASAVLTAYDPQMRYVVVTSDYVAYGPYATREAADKAIAGGWCANRPGTQAMVLAMRAAPRATPKPKRATGPSA